MADPANPLVCYIKTRPNGWSAVREAVQAGLTRPKDTFFLLHMDIDAVKLCKSEKLRTEFGARGETFGGMQPLLAALDKRDPDNGMQVFLIDLGADKDLFMQAATVKIAPHAGSGKTEVWTRDMWNAVQLIKQQQQEQQAAK